MFLTRKLLNSNVFVLQIKSWINSDFGAKFLYHWRSSVGVRRRAFVTDKFSTLPKYSIRLIMVAKQERECLGCRGMLLISGPFTNFVMRWNFSQGSSASR